MGDLPFFHSSLSQFRILSSTTGLRWADRFVNSITPRTPRAHSSHGPPGTWWRREYHFSGNRVNRDLVGWLGITLSFNQLIEHVRFVRLDVALLPASRADTGHQLGRMAVHWQSADRQ